MAATAKKKTDDSPDAEKTVVGPDKTPGAEAAAAEAEATGKPLEFEHGGRTYTMDRETIDDVDLLEMIGDLVTRDRYSMLPLILRKTLGDTQWQAFKDEHRLENGRVPTDDMDELWSALNAALGE